MVGKAARNAAILLRARPNDECSGRRVILGKMAVWTAKNRGRYDPSKWPNPSDLTDEG
jgi:hypothetical protein